MITISQIPQNNSLNTLHAASGQFDLFQMSDLPLDRPTATSPTLVPPMPVIADTGPSFEAVMERYFSEVVEVNRAQKGQDFVRSLLRSCIYPTLADRPFFDIKRDEILALTKAIGTTRLKPYLGRVDGRQGRANSVHWYLRRFYVWASSPEAEGGVNLLPMSPMLGLKRPYRDGERDRVLNDDELRAFWRATGEEGYPFGTIARLLLLSGQRRSEVANAFQWQFNRSERLLTIPINKPRRPHIAPLSTLALELLEQVPHSDPRALVFPGAKGKTIYSAAFKSANQRLRERMIALMREDYARAGRDPNEAFIAHWTFHDLRRSCATRLCEMGHGIETIDRLLNHGHSGGGVGRTINWTTRIYVRCELLDERRAALEDLAKYVRKLVGG
jgi:integrase